MRINTMSERKYRRTRSTLLVAGLAAACMAVATPYWQLKNVSGTVIKESTGTPYWVDVKTLDKEVIRLNFSDNSLEKQVDPGDKLSVRVKENYGSVRNVQRLEAFYPRRNVTLAGR
jgi:hypothetical protein